ncbi:MAG: hypothetical protein NG737_02235 [Omnitrophica bacterium]|nr:hypothetical protein [Candidatus Omnitrophota bacterium]
MKLKWGDFAIKKSLRNPKNMQKIKDCKVSLSKEIKTIPKKTNSTVKEWPKGFIMSNINKAVKMKNNFMFIFLI